MLLNFDFLKQIRFGNAIHKLFDLRIFNQKAVGYALTEKSE